MPTALLTRPVPAPLRADTSRRGFLAGIAAAGLLAGCGTPASGSAAGAAVAGYPRTVRHEAGETVLDRPAPRVVSVTDGAELGALLALGVPPAAFGQRNDPLLPWIAAAGGTDPALERFPIDSEIDVERLAALRPDVILGQYGFVTDDNIGTLQGIAPTVATSFVDWRESLRQVAETTGTEDRAREVLADVEARIDAAAGRLADLAGIRVAVISVFSGGEVYALNADSPAGEVLARFGAAPLPAAETPGEAVNAVSAELVGTVLDADVALVQLFDDDRGGYDALRASGVLDATTAYRAGRVVELSGVDSQALYFSSVLTLPWCTDVLERSVRG